MRCAAAAALAVPAMRPGPFPERGMSGRDVVPARRGRCLCRERRRDGTHRRHGSAVAARARVPAPARDPLFGGRWRRAPAHGTRGDGPAVNVRLRTAPAEVRDLRLVHEVPLDARAVAATEGNGAFARNPERDPGGSEELSRQNCRDDPDGLFELP